MKIHHLSLAQAYATMKSGPDGLTGAEAERRLKEYGTNELQRLEQQPAVLMLLREFGHFFALILWLAAGLAFYAESKEPGEGMATLGLAIVCVIVVNGFFSFWQAYRAEQAIIALQKLLPRVTEVLRDGSVVQISAAEIVPGDVILKQAITSRRMAESLRHLGCA